MTAPHGKPAPLDWARDPKRLARFGWALALALGVAFAIHVLTADGIHTVAGGRLGGDWAPFRTAGELVRRDPALVLDVDAQRLAMQEFFDDGFLTFAYPPVVAFLFVPATFVSFTTGYVVFVALLVLAAIAATRLTLDVLGVHDPDWRRVGYLGALTFLPTYRAYTGAQNAPITWLVLAATALLVKRDRPWAAGMVLGLLWFKPQFVLPVLALVAALRLWRVAAAATLVGVAFWVANAAVYGVGWTSEWYTGVVASVDEGNIGFSTNITVSLVEWLRWVVGGSTGLLLALGVAALLGLGFVAVGWTRRTPEVLLPLTSAALLVTAPHALVYEMTMLVPVIGAGLVAGGRERVPEALGLWALGALAVVVRHPLARIPYVALVVGWWLWQLRRVDREWPTSRLRQEPVTVGHG